MKKFLAIFLTACMLFSISALAAETTFVEPFTILDFGSESRLDDIFKANLLSSAEKINATMEENDDSWTLTVTSIPEYNGMDYDKVPQVFFPAISNINRVGTRVFPFT